ncbi:MAG: hypothetical protein AAFY60_15245, partial [Myxococcota bacterium]
LGAPARLLLFGTLPDAQWLPKSIQNPVPDVPEAQAPEESAPKPDALFVHGTLDPTRSVARAAFAERLNRIESVTLEEAVLASEGWALQPNELARLSGSFFNRGSADGTRLTKLPWSFAPQLRLSTMQWVLTVLTVVLPLLLMGFIYLLFRRVKRTIDQERAEHARKLAGSDA